MDGRDGLVSVRPSQLDEDESVQYYESTNCIYLFVMVDLLVAANCGFSLNVEEFSLVKLCFVASLDVCACD